MNAPVTVGPQHLLLIVEEIANNGRIASQRNDYSTRAKVRAVASWLLLAAGLPLARVAEIVDVSGPGAREGSRRVLAEIRRGHGAKLDLLAEVLGRLARSSFSLELPDPRHRLPRAQNALRSTLLPVVDRDACPTVRPCPREGCQHHLGVAARSSCTLDVAAEGPLTRIEIGELLGVSPRRVRQIEEGALAKLRHTSIVEGYT